MSLRRHYNSLTVETAPEEMRLQAPAENRQRRRRRVVPWQTGLDTVCWSVSQSTGVEPDWILGLLVSQSVSQQV